mgnify:CR=1 FL=1
MQHSVCFTASKYNYIFFFELNMHVTNKKTHLFAARPTPDKGKKIEDSIDPKHVQKIIVSHLYLTYEICLHCLWTYKFVFCENTLSDVGAR